ncbi:MAG: 2-5 ligase family protein [Betaproteobacteria bacterium]|nr:2-5 ligase family protein [Betaproteobacteria bacterium]
MSPDTIAFVTDYATDTRSWSDRQLQYKYGALLIIPPEPHLSAANKLRKEYRWAQGAEIDAHISLTVRLPRAITTADWQELESIAAKIQRFTVRYGPLKHYLPFPGVCWDIEPQDRLDHLRAALEMASCFKGALARPYPFSAHMTIAELLTVEQTEQYMIDLETTAPRGDFVCGYVSYVAPDADFRFSERARLKLGD